MIFLLEYDRKHGAICKQKIFGADQRAQAQIERLAIELELHKSGTLHEVVLLEAADETALMRTHERYFRSPRELVESMIAPQPSHA